MDSESGKLFKKKWFRELLKKRGTEMFELTPEQRDIKQAAREFAEKEFKEIARELDQKEEFDDRL